MKKARNKGRNRIIRNISKQEMREDEDVFTEEEQAGEASLKREQTGSLLDEEYGKTSGLYGNGRGQTAVLTEPVKNSVNGKEQNRGGAGTPLSDGENKENRNILSRFGTRLLLMVIGYVAVLVLFFSMISAYGTYSYFQQGDISETTDFMQTEYVKEQLVYRAFYSVVRSLYMRDEYKASDVADQKVKIISFSNGYEKTYTLGEVLATTPDYVAGSEDDFLENIRYSITSEYYGGVSVYSTNVNVRDYERSSVFYRMNAKDYRELIQNESVVKPFSSLYTEQGDVKVLNDEGEEVLSRLYQEDLADSFYLPETLDAGSDHYRLNGEYYILKNDSIFVCSMVDEIRFNRYTGLTNLDYLQNFVYVPTLYMDSGMSIREAFLLAPLFTDEEEVVIDALEDSKYEALASYCWALSELENVRFDLQMEYADIVVKKNGEESGGGYASSSSGAIATGEYPVYAQRIRDNYDLVITSDGINLQSFYLNEATGKKMEYSYIEPNDGWLTDMLSPDTKITVGMNLGNVDQAAKVLYRFCKMIPQPVAVAIMSFLLLLIVVFLLSIGVDGYTVIEHFPVELNLLFTVMSIAAGCVIAAGIFSNTPVSEVLTPTNPWNVAAMLSTIAFFYLIVAEMYLTVVRRVKRRTLLKELLIIRLLTWINSKLRRGMEKLNGDKRVKLQMTALVFLNIASIPCGTAIYTQTGFPFLVFVVAGVVLFFDFIGIIRLFDYFRMLEVVLETSKKIENGDFEAHVNVAELEGTTKELGESLNNIRNGLFDAVEQSTKDERLKAELITNVSHDIKTPLTSIINYVELLKWEKTDSPKIQEYVDILDKKSQRLKQLVLDLVEASKVSTGNIELEMMNIDFSELLSQTVGEYEEKFPEKELGLVVEIPETPVIIYADGRRIFRIVENLFQNALKYSLSGTRVYVSLFTERDENGSEQAVFSIKNISQERLNLSAEDLTRRFVRGDQSRKTEGSGLGLSIAKNLTNLQNGKLSIVVDGDLFKAEVSFPVVSR